MSNSFSCVCLLVMIAGRALVVGLVLTVVKVKLPQ
jgi:hypothetical protein